MQNIKLKQPIFSFTGKELLDNEDPNFLHRSQRVKELEPPVIEYAYANTLKFKIKSSKFGQKENEISEPPKPAEISVTSDGDLF